MVTGEPDGTLRISAVVQYTAAEMHALMHGSQGKTVLTEEGTENQASSWEDVTDRGATITNETSPSPDTGSYVLAFTLASFIE